MFQHQHQGLGLQVLAPQPPPLEGCLAKTTQLTQPLGCLEETPRHLDPSLLQASVRAPMFQVINT